MLCDDIQGLLVEMIGELRTLEEHELIGEPDHVANQRDGRHLTTNTSCYGQYLDLVLDMSTCNIVISNHPNGSCTYIHSNVVTFL